MPELILISLIFGYTAFIIYKRIKNFRLGQNSCSGCSSCPAKDNCNKHDIDSNKSIDKHSK